MPKASQTCFQNLRLNHEQPPLSADPDQPKTGRLTELDLIYMAPTATASFGSKVFPVTSVYML